MASKIDHAPDIDVSAKSLRSKSLDELWSMDDKLEKIPDNPRDLWPYTDVVVKRRKIINEIIRRGQKNDSANK
jgi:hypothetical protein